MASQSQRSSTVNGRISATEPPLPPIPSVRFPTPDVSAPPSGAFDHNRNGFPVPSITPDVSNDGFADTNALVDSADTSFQNYQSRRGVKTFNKAGDTLSVIQTDVSKIQGLASPLQSVVDSEPAKAIRRSITALVDGLPALLKVLDQVAEIHPFIKIAVGAFRVAVELDLKRKDAEKKIALLFVEMRDMMAVLVQLQDIDRNKRAGEGNHTVQDRMQDLIVKTEKDIRTCANACNTYAKKKLWSKVLQSSSWVDEFKGYIQSFTNRRGEFEFALSMYIGRAVNMANDRLISVEEKMNRVLRYLEACVSPEEQELTRQVDLRGGPQAVLKDEKLLRELYENRGATAGLSGSAERRAARHGVVVDEFKELQQELQIDPQTAIRENMEQFEAKFIIQQRELEEELKRTIRREGDRVIEGVLSGPHDKIVDPDIHEIWEEMRWRGNVKARHLVLALRDHFREKLDHLKHTKSDATPTTSTRVLSAQDEWTLEYINVTRLQPIIEAFDDDASGFITIAEVNAFTMARPENWSLLHWLAYWAIGYQMVMSDYAAKLDVLLAKMFSLKQLVLPANRTSVEQYLDNVWPAVTELTSAFRRISMDETLFGKFESYVHSEEDRLRNNLKTAKYDFDAADTLELVRGPGRIEKHIFPLLYLLLQRDFEIMRIARTHILHVDELFDSTGTLAWVFMAFQDRCADLSDLFKQQKLDPSQQFKIFAFELYKYWHDDTELWSMKRLREAKFTDYPYDDSVEAQNVDPADVVNHPLQMTDESSFIAPPFSETEEDKQADPLISRILGHWSGYCILGDLYPSQSMLALNFHVSPSNPKQYECSGIVPNGSNWNVTGSYSADDGGKVTYTFIMTFTARFVPVHFRGEVDPNGTELTGTWVYSGENDDPKSTFLFKRLPSDVMRFWPKPSELVENKAQALWSFAISAVLADVRRRLGSWSWLRQRWETGQRYVDLLERRRTHALTREESMDLAKCQRSMTPEEARLYYVLRDLRERSIPVHYNVGCDVCGDNIRGTRVLCLSCGMKTTIDLCDKPDCLAGEIGLDARDDLTGPHLPSHDIFKVRTAINQHREFGNIYRAAQRALKVAHEVLDDATELQNNPPADPRSTAEPTTKPAAGGLPHCVTCNEKVSQPCWYCIECEDGIFVCAACDTKHGGLTVGKHKGTHGLVRCQAPDPSADASADRAAQLETRMGTLDSNIKEMQYKIEQSFVGVDDKIDVVQNRISVRVDEKLEKLSRTMDERLQRLSGRMSAVDDRLERIEDLLLILGRRFGGDGNERVGTSTSPRKTVRHATWSSSEEGASYVESSVQLSESAFSAWVREMRKAT